MSGKIEQVLTYFMLVFFLLLFFIGIPMLIVVYISKMNNADWEDVPFSPEDYNGLEWKLKKEESYDMARRGFTLSKLADVFLANALVSIVFFLLCFGCYHIYALIQPRALLMEDQVWWFLQIFVFFTLIYLVIYVVLMVLEERNIKMLAKLVYRLGEHLDGFSMKKGKREKIKERNFVLRAISIALFRKEIEDEGATVVRMYLAKNNKTAGQTKLFGILFWILCGISIVYLLFLALFFL